MDYSPKHQMRRRRKKKNNNKLYILSIKIHFNDTVVFQAIFFHYLQQSMSLENVAGCPAKCLLVRNGRFGSG